MPLARSLLDRSSGTVSGGEAATAHLGRAASAAFDAGSPCVGRPESIKLKGPPLRCAQWGTKEKGGLGSTPLGGGKKRAPLGHIEKCGRALRGTARPRRGPPSCGETFQESKKKKAAAGPLFLDLSAYFMKRMAVLAIMSFSPASSNWMRRSISPPMGVTSTIFPGPKALCRMCIPGRKSGNGALWGA